MCNTYELAELLSRAIDDKITQEQQKIKSECTLFLNQIKKIKNLNQDNKESNLRIGSQRTTVSFVWYFVTSIAFIFLVSVLSNLV
jgi:hypothetical protein